MKNTNIIKVISISLITLIILSIVGYSYAYFSLEIEGTGKDISMTAGDLRLIYKDETDLKLTDAVPGDEVSKVITVTNAGTRSARYSLYWGDLINTIENFELHATLDCKSYTNYGETTQTENGTCDKIYRAVPISNTTTTGNIKGNISIDPGITQEYTVTVKFDNKNYPQDDNMNKTFTGKIGIEEYIDPAVTNCTFNGELVQGAEYVNGQYTYHYMQEMSASKWQDITSKGWGVTLTDKDSTATVTSDVCTTINNKPVVSMSYTFYDSKATSINLSNSNTSNVTNMKSMFQRSSATSIIGLNKFNTSNVTNMWNMFLKSSATMLDLSSFDTSNVTDMHYMFFDSEATIVNGLDNFNTSNVTNMVSMFRGSKARSLNLSSFDTSNVTNMSSMFYMSQATSIDLSSFDTSNVTNMSGMFSDSSATSLDLSNFNTSNVTSMSGMFRWSKVRSLNLSSFDTSNVTGMNSMFRESSTTMLDLSSFDTSNVTNMCYMFSDSSATSLDLSSFDTSKVTDMSYMFAQSKLKSIYVSDKFITDNVGISNDMFLDSTNLVGGAGTVFDSNKKGKEYARIDGGTSSPGYFTLKTN